MEYMAMSLEIYPEEGDGMRVPGGVIFVTKGQ